MRRTGGHYVRLYSLTHNIIMLCRPALVSLDLSYNLLSDLEAAVRLLAEVSSLRNLLLMGNPLSVSKHINFCWQK